MKIVFSLLIVVHALIHIFGFVKAFELSEVKALTLPISKSMGVLWLLACFLLISFVFLSYINSNFGWLLGFSGLLLSQILIFVYWQDAKFGTIPNVLILVAVVIGYGTAHFSNQYRQEVSQGFEQTNALSLLIESDILSLPTPVQRYMRYTGAVGQPKVHNVKIKFVGQIRKNEQSAWMPFLSEQYNFIPSTTRLFFMNATMKNLPVVGFHCFKDGHAFMDIRLLSLFKVQYQSGNEMDTAETVTFFNDMCCMAPATLIDKRIKWLEVQDNSVKASFTSNNITISAWLYFNEKGELINFVSDDRYAAGDDNKMKKIRWSTPLKDYKEMNGHKLAGYAEAIYSYPEGDLCYGTFSTTDVIYNCKKFE